MIQLFEMLARKGASCSFIRIRYTNSGVKTVDGQGEEAENTLRIVNYGRLVREDAEKLEPHLPTLTGETSAGAMLGATVEQWALVAVYASRRKSMAGENDDYTCSGVYRSTEVLGVKMHLATREYHLGAVAVRGARKVIGEEKEYKVVKSAPLTLAKAAVVRDYGLQSGQYRQYKFSGLERVAVNGDTWEIDATPLAPDMLAAGVLDGSTVAQY